MTYNEQIKVMIDYIKLKIEQGDFHAVADAANDIREMEAQERVKPTSPAWGFEKDDENKD